MKQNDPASSHSRAKLRRLDLNKKNPLIVTVSSGKGGVGKTLTIVNFALAASHLGRKVLILDGDLGMANVDVVLGLQAKYNIRDVFDGQIPLSQIILDGPLGMKIIPSGSGITSLHSLSYTQRQILGEQLASLRHDFDLLLIDTAAGIGPNVLALSSASHRRVVVTTSDPHAMTDAYALIKVLAEEENLGSFDLLINMVHSQREALAVATRLKEVAQRFLKVKLNYLGFIPADPSVGQAVRQRQAASPASVHSLAGQAWHQIGSQLFTQQGYPQQDISLNDFWTHLMRPHEPRQGYQRASS